MIQIRNFINGQWQEETGGKTVPLYNPSTGETIGSVPVSKWETGFFTQYIVFISYIVVFLHHYAPNWCKRVGSWRHDAATTQGRACKTHLWS